MKLFRTFAINNGIIVMIITEQTVQQIDRAIRKIADKFPAGREASQLTDIHLCVSQDTGELMAFDDDDNEITRCVVEEWIGNNTDDFYADITAVLRKVIAANKELVESMGILKPYSFVLEDDDKENIAELYVVDDETMIISGDLMQGLDDDLNDFLKQLLP